MLGILIPCGFAMALLAPLGHAQAHVAEASARAENGARLSASSPASTPTIVVQSDMASFTVGDLVVENPWARESVTPTGAAYLTVRNGGDQDDRLIGVSSEVADEAELHSTTMQDGVMRMRPVEAVEVPAGGEAVLEPGGIHVMLIGLKAPLEEGSSFALTLEFEKAGEIEVITTIEDIRHDAGGHHGHGN